MIQEKIQTNLGKTYFIIDINKMHIVETIIMNNNGICDKSNTSCPCSQMKEIGKCLYNLYGELLV